MEMMGQRAAEKEKRAVEKETNIVAMISN